MWKWALTIAGGVLATAGLGVFLAVQELEKANQWAGVLSLFATLAGLVLTCIGMVSARRQPGGGQPEPQRVERLDAGNDVDVVDAVRGSLRMGTAPPTVTTPPVVPPGSAQASAPPVVPGEQQVRDVRAKGAIRIVRGIDGDVDINP